MLPLPLNGSLFPYQRFGASNIENVHIALGEVKNYFDLTPAEGVKLVIETGKIPSQDIIDEIKRTADIYLAKEEPSAVKPYPAKKQDEPKQGFWKIFLPLLLGLMIGAVAVIGIDVAGLVQMPSHTQTFNNGYDKGKASRDMEVRGLNAKVTTLETEKTQSEEETKKTVHSEVNDLKSKIRDELNSLQQLPLETTFDTVNEKYVNKGTLDKKIQKVIDGLKNKPSNLPVPSTSAGEQ
jgi:gas vesicle protein